MELMNNLKNERKNQLSTLPVQHSTFTFDNSDAFVVVESVEPNTIYSNIEDNTSDNKNKSKVSINDTSIKSIDLNKNKSKVSIKDTNIVKAKKAPKLVKPLKNTSSTKGRNTVKDINTAKNTKNSNDINTDKDDINKEKDVKIKNNIINKSNSNTSNMNEIDAIEDFEIVALKQDYTTNDISKSTKIDIQKEPERRDMSKIFGFGPACMYGRFRQKPLSKKRKNSSSARKERKMKRLLEQENKKYNKTYTKQWEYDRDENESPMEDLSEFGKNNKRVKKLRRNTKSLHLDSRFNQNRDLGGRYYYGNKKNSINF